MQIDTRAALAQVSPQRSVSTRECSDAANDAKTVSASTYFDFEKMTVGEFSDAISELCSTGQITHQEMNDLGDTYLRAFPGLNREQARAMPLKISFGDLREDIAFARTAGEKAAVDRFERALDVMQRFDGKARRVDVTA